MNCKGWEPKGSQHPLVIALIIYDAQSTRAGIVIKLPIVSQKKSVGFKGVPERHTPPPTIDPAYRLINWAPFNKFESVKDNGPAKKKF